MDSLIPILLRLYCMHLQRCLTEILCLNYRNLLNFSEEKDTSDRDIQLYNPHTVTKMSKIVRSPTTAKNFITPPFGAIRIKG